MKFKDIVLIVLILMVVGMGGYLVYDKVFMDDMHDVDENNKVDNDDKIENNSSIDDSDNKEDIVENDKIQYVYNGIDYYKNHDGSYGIVENIIVNSSEYSAQKWYFNVNLSLDGKIYVFDKAGKKIDVISNVSDVIDIHEFVDEIGELTEKIYILTKSGDVYVYRFADLLSGKYVATKVDGISGVERIKTINWCPQEGTGCIINHVAITTNGEIIKLSGFSV